MDPVKVRHSNGVTYILQTDAGDELRAHHAQLRLWRIAPAYLRRLEEDGRGRDGQEQPRGATRWRSIIPVRWRRSPV